MTRDNAAFFRALDAITAAQSREEALRLYDEACRNFPLGRDRLALANVFAHRLLNP